MQQASLSGAMYSPLSAQASVSFVHGQESCTNDHAVSLAFACGWSFDLMLSGIAAFAQALAVPLPGQMRKKRAA